ncbi:hypothetical protein [Pontibacter vulgaris]|uniref:hypothetical protein n=1 Tax=Pontibacter vulgaris TaxID=2905679 RepID=UPI001FA71F43|nr:hypothetical protein [Pontibacter vulgaris]
MSESPVILTSAANQLQKLFDTNELQAPDRDQLLRKLTHAVAYLLRTDLNRLMHILYRIDVEERLVKQAMAPASVDEDIAHNIALLILQRELQKAHTRQKYSQL